MKNKKYFCKSGIVLFLSFFSLSTLADEVLTDAPTAATSAPPATSPYALPWQLRSVMTGNSFRFDSANAFYKTKGNQSGFVSASVFTGSYSFEPGWAGIARLGVVKNAPPAGTPGGMSATNPLFGVVRSMKLTEEWRLAFFMGATPAVGTGGGNYPNAATATANATGLLARSAMDNALYAVNYFTLIPGIDLAYIANNLTVQFETTLLQLNRVRGGQVDKDKFRTNLTSGIEVGYAVASNMIIQGELRYQRWLKNSAAFSGAKPAIDNLSFAVGPRFQVKVGSSTLRPGIAYAQGLHGPIASNTFNTATHSHKVVFVDLPFAF